jgi:hypothetical protein
MTDYVYCDDLPRWTVDHPEVLARLAERGLDPDTTTAGMSGVWAERLAADGGTP